MELLSTQDPLTPWLDKEDLGTTEFPDVETPLINGEIAFSQDRGGPGPACIS